MKDIPKLRTIAFISHGGSGKTSLAEAILYLTGTTTRLGRGRRRNERTRFRTGRNQTQYFDKRGVSHVSMEKARSPFCGYPG